MLIADLNPRQSFRLSGITFRHGSLTERADNGAIRVKGTCAAVRIHHCHFDRLYATNGARYVARYNDFYNCMPNTHGTEGGPQTGVRAIEIYNNRFHWTFPSSGGQLRSGTALIHDNTWEGVAPTHVMVLQQYRIITNDPPLGPSAGSNKWDLNDTEGNGTSVPGHSPFVYASGTAGASPPLSLTVSPSPNWATNQWVNYEVSNLDQQKNPGYPMSSYIISNTGDTIKFARASQGTNLAFNAGNRFKFTSCWCLWISPVVGREI